MDVIGIETTSGLQNGSLHVAFSDALRAAKQILDKNSTHLYNSNKPYFNTIH